MKRRILLAIIIVTSVIAVLGIIFGAITQAPKDGEVTVTLEVRYSTVGSPYAYFVHVPIGASLKDALLATEAIRGEDSPQGYQVHTVGDIQADLAAGQQWRITNYEQPLTDTPENVQIQEDTHFELVLTPLQS